MSTEVEGKIQVADGTNLYTKTWTPTGPTKAKLIFVHGFNEHINRYNEFFPLVAAQGIQVLSWDQRGWGRSITKPSERGLTGPTSVVVTDMVTFFKSVFPSTVPVFVLGHSMGGGEVLILAADNKYKDLVGRIRGWILESPFIGFTPAEEPSTLKVAVGKLVGKLLPNQHLKQVIPPEYLSRDPAIVESVKNDPLCHNLGTLEGLASLLDRTAALGSGKVRLGDQVQSVWLAHGNADKICSFEKAMRFLDEQKEIKDKEKTTYDGAYHQLHTDLCKGEFLTDMTSWILKRSGDNEETPVEAKL